MSTLPLPIEALNDRHRDEVIAFFATDVETNLFQITLAEDGDLKTARRGNWLGARAADGALRAVLVARFPVEGGPALSVVPAGDPAACLLLGQQVIRRGGARMLIGERTACDATWLGMGRPWFRIAYDQRLFVCRKAAAGPRVPIRPADVSDVPDLVGMHRGLLVEDLQIPEDHIDPTAQFLRLREHVEKGRYFVVDGGTVEFPLRYCIDIGEPTTRGTQVGGTFVPPPFRGKGVATAATRALLDHLLGDRGLPLVTLHANEANSPALACYERAGFSSATPFRLMAR